ncbi:peptide MFS transporter [Roseateles noduli]|uniref:peptide MFS transporter n=1 Tax=Roseateles noduli TaxID=2052484 RepID=UPI003D653FED
MSINAARMPEYVGPQAATTSPPATRRFFGHPAGLGWLSFCEFWERTSFYGMQALLVFYLSNYLLLPEHAGKVVGLSWLRSAVESLTGPRSSQQFASMLFGLYVGLVYFLPLLGGLVGDRWLGRTRTVVAGAILMATGHFLMAVEAALLPALACLVVGVGAFKGNIAAQVSGLYAEDDTRRPAAFQIFILTVQLAAIVAPVLCGTLGERVGWHWGFASAGVFMLFGLAAYLCGRRWLPPEPPRAKAAGPQATSAALSRSDWVRTGLLFLILPMLALATVGYGQMGNGYALWSQKHMDMNLAGFLIPVTWLQTADGICRTLSMLIAMAFWRWWAQRGIEPDELAKIATATLFAAIAPALLMLPALSVEAGGGRFSIAWTFAYSLVNALAFATIVPVGLALYTRVAPAGLRGLMIGIYFLHVFAGSIAVGWLAGLLETVPGSTFWGLHAGLVAAAGIGLLLVKLAFGRSLAPKPAPAGVPGAR